MSDFNPVALFFILYESAGAWFWPLLGLALVLAAGVIVSAWRLRRAGRPMKRPIAAALIIGLVAAAAATFAVPGWTLADVGALGAAVDYAFALLIALAPAAVVAALAFMLAAHRCARRKAAA